MENVCEDIETMLRTIYGFAHVFKKPCAFLAEHGLALSCSSLSENSLCDSNVFFAKKWYNKSLFRFKRISDALTVQKSLSN